MHLMHLLLTESLAQFTCRDDEDWQANLYRKIKTANYPR
jgi:hypothetical protein